MIRSWKHKGLKRFYETGDKSGVQPKHAESLREILFQLTSAIKPTDMNTAGNNFHKLQGDMKEIYSVTVKANWRITFRFEDGDAFIVNYLDYH